MENIGFEFPSSTNHCTKPIQNLKSRMDEQFRNEEENEIKLLSV